MAKKKPTPKQVLPEHQNRYIFHSEMLYSPIVLESGKPDPLTPFLVGNGDELFAPLRQRRGVGGEVN
ncbi:hypothetical protein H6F50_04180 [Coleofasciculus sp. FACHB-712]|uniref:hypothetical protein n=1 Tax=Cyanophyceae TaxID=3028117 RepID=UPI0016831423|nr:MULTISPECIES: hypothetical protein [unclassified Coleofasciculus]MBD1941558.1 hypothetical protein [Coleofasciculus sp. FACHB-712]MBD2539227.1 hypothetical protein [Coleofasciculus sp. FACHB-SPT36]